MAESSQDSQDTTKTRDADMDDDDVDSNTQYRVTNENLTANELRVKNGKALIISNNFYGCENERIGNNVDKENIKTLLESIGFEVEVIEDSKDKHLTKGYVENQLNFWASNCCGVLDNTDCFILIILSHGNRFEDNNEDYISFVNKEKLPISTILSKFANNKCEVMCGKPKLFFIQACRGNKHDKGVIITKTNPLDISMGSNEDSDQHIEVGNMTDFFIAQSSFDEYVSYLNSKNGSWFIEALVEVFRDGIKTEKELHQMMIEVNRKVSKKALYNPFVGKIGTSSLYKEVPCFKSTMTKSIFFQYNADKQN